MIASDAQKYFTLRFKRDLITNRMYRFIRHPNYLGEMMVIFTAKRPAVFASKIKVVTMPPARRLLLYNQTGRSPLVSGTATTVSIE